MNADGQAIHTGSAPSAIAAAYRARTPKSAAMQARAKAVQPGGNSRQAACWPPYPLTIERAEGVHLFDIDGHRYIDLLNNYSAMVHGHAYPPIVEAVARQVARGTGWAASNPAQVELAERMVARVPGLEQIRFTNSGSEAGNLALTIARTVTGRHKVLMARYGYHGSLEEFESGSFDRPGPMTLLATYNDLADFERVLAAHGDEIAAVFLEPVLGSGGVLAADPAFLNGVAGAAHDAGALFVLDEVITLRLASGGVQGQLGITPDLTMFGKLLGGGFPVGAVGGLAKWLAIFDPDHMKAFHSGTFNANPVTMTAGAIALAELTPRRIDAMAALARRLETGLARAAQKTGLALSIARVGSLLNLYFSDRVPSARAMREDEDVIARFHLAALNHGLFLAPRGMIALSTVMDDVLIDEVVDRAAAAMADVAAELS